MFFVAFAFAAEPRHLSVSEALAALEAHNPGLRRAELAVDAARAGSLAAAAPLLPTLTATGSYVRNNEEVSLDLGAILELMSLMSGQDLGEVDEIVMQPLDAWSATGTLRLPLVVPSAWASWAAARQGSRAAGAAAEASATSLRALAAQAFWQAAAAEQVSAIQAASVGRSRALVVTAERALAAGTGTELGLYQARTELARREAELEQGRANVEKTRVAVGVLLGAAEPVVVEVEPVDPAPVDLEARLAEAGRQRAELRAADAQVAAASAQLGAVRLGLLPSLSASASVFASTEPYLTGENSGWRAGLDLSWPLIQGGARAAAEARAKVALADAEAAREATALSVAQQVRNAVADLGAAQARRAATLRQVELAEAAAALAERGFSAGTVGAAEVLDALERADGARLAAVEAGARLASADAALRAAVGAR